MEEYEKIELRSEEIQEILGTPPQRIVRWGTTVAVLTFCALLFVSYFIRYPDIIKAPIVLTTANPPMDINAAVSSSISNLYVKNNHPVKKGDILGQLDGLANYNDIFFLEQQLRGELATIDREVLLNFKIQEDLQLGAIQPFYTKFIRNYEAFRYGVSTNFSGQNIGSLNAQINSLRNEINVNNAKKPVLEEELKTAEDAVKLLQDRYRNDVSLIGELQSAIFLSKRLKTELKNLDIENAEKITEISNLQTQIKISEAQSGTSNSNSLMDIKGDVSNLLNEIEKWKRDNILIAPKDGVVVLGEKISENKSVEKGEKILSIVPQGEQSFYGKVMLPIKGSGKVLKGQEVVIKFDNFPYQEYGMIKGIVEHKSILPNDTVQNIIVSIDNTLITNQNKPLAYTPFMQGTAEIITKDRRFIERIFENVAAFSEEH